MTESWAVVASRVHSKGMKHINTLTCSFYASISGAQFLSNAHCTAMTVLKSNVNITGALKRAYAPNFTH